MVIEPYMADESCGKYYLASDADAIITHLVTARDAALIAHSKLAVRMKELDQDNARWISARDVWAAEMRAKDERIRELKKTKQILDEVIDYASYCRANSVIADQVMQITEGHV